MNFYQTPASVLISETTITAAHINTVFFAVTHSYWFTSSSNSSDQQISKVSLSTDLCQFVRP